jgi:hypothetical protein
MTVFLVLQQSGLNSQKLSEAVAKAYPNDTYALGNNGWIVSGTGTAQEVSDKIGISGGENGSGIVVEIASYYGRTNPAVWSWIKNKWEGSPSG